MIARLFYYTLKFLRGFPDLCSLKLQNLPKISLELKTIDSRPDKKT